MLKPVITLKWAQTLDGQLADDRDQSQWISGPEERRYTHDLRSRNQAVVVGAQTFLKDRCQLTVRDVEMNGPQPVRVIIDPRGRVIDEFKNDASLGIALTSGPRRTYLITDVLDEDNDLPVNLAHISYRFESFNAWLEGAIDMLAINFALREQQALKGIIVEGGAVTLAAFLTARLADHVEVAISPLILGGSRHRVSTGQLLKDADRFVVGSPERLGNDILLRYSMATV